MNYLDEKALDFNGQGFYVQAAGLFLAAMFLIFNVSWHVYAKMGKDGGDFPGIAMFRDAWRLMFSRWWIPVLPFVCYLVFYFQPILSTHVLSTIRPSMDLREVCNPGADEPAPESTTLPVLAIRPLDYSAWSPKSARRIPQPERIRPIIGFYNELTFAATSAETYFEMHYWSLLSYIAAWPLLFWMERSLRARPELKRAYPRTINIFRFTLLLTPLLFIEDVNYVRYLIESISQDSLPERGYLHGWRIVIVNLYFVLYNLCFSTLWFALLIQAAEPRLAPGAKTRPWLDRMFNLFPALFVIFLVCELYTVLLTIGSAAVPEGWMDWHTEMRLNNLFYSSWPANVDLLAGIIASWFLLPLPFIVWRRGCGLTEAMKILLRLWRDKATMLIGLGLSLAAIDFVLCLPWIWYQPTSNVYAAWAMICGSYGSGFFSNLLWAFLVFLLVISRLWSFFLAAVVVFRLLEENPAGESTPETV